MQHIGAHGFLVERPLDRVEPFPINSRYAGLSEIAVDDDSVFHRPAQGHGMLAQPVLTLCTSVFSKRLTRQKKSWVASGSPRPRCNQFLRPEIAKNQFPMLAQGASDLLHRFDAGTYGLATPVI
jgi:hypothetical protein